MTTEEIQDYLQNPVKPDLRYFPFQVAQELSDLAAVLLYDIRNRIVKRKKPLKKDGFSWTYDTLETFAANHPYASESGIRKAFLALEKDGFIRIEKTGRYNKKRYDEKWWYALTRKGETIAAKRRMRFLPDAAASPDPTKKEAILGIPKAVTLEHFRFQLHKSGGDGYVRIDPEELQVPYSPKTIGRHLDGIVGNGILERHPEDKHRYCVADRWKEDDSPLTVLPSKLLPPINRGDIGLIVAPSGTAKTSFSTFLAVQHALAGYKVMYVTLEEPAINIVHRMYAQEYGVSYSELHQANAASLNEVRTKHKAGSERIASLGRNLKIVDLSGKYPTPDIILAEVSKCQEEGFRPDIVFVDQLEFTGDGVENEDSELPDESPELDEEAEVEHHGMDLPLATAFRDTFRGQPFKTWVLHQADGNPRPDFEMKNIAGGRDVAECFDIVLGIGRTDHGKEGLRVDVRLFSMKPMVIFDTTFGVDFPHMRFKPKK